MKRYLKTLLGRIAYHSGLYKLFLQNKAVIVLFHRVDDHLKGNPISCTSDEFRAYCRFFRKYFRVVSLGELLQTVASGGDLSGLLVITFDDGYKDNYELAAKELVRLGLPACFFLVTNFISSDLIPSWDAKRSIRTRWMTWDDVRALHAQGFEIGAHTMNHVDLSAVSTEDAISEITGSKERLERELEEAVVYFSYPYGRAPQITKESREAVRQAGYKCCLSAYGGAVERQTDPFYMKRTVISQWYISPSQFGFEIMFDEP